MPGIFSTGPADVVGAPGASAEKQIAIANPTSTSTASDPLFELALYNSESIYDESDELVRVLSAEVAMPSGKALDLRGFSAEVLQDVPDQLLAALRPHIQTPLLSPYLPASTIERWTAVLDGAATRPKPSRRHSGADGDAMLRPAKRSAPGPAFDCHAATTPAHVPDDLPGVTPLGSSRPVTAARTESPAVASLAAQLGPIQYAWHSTTFASPELRLAALKRALNTLSSNMQLSYLDMAITDKAGDLVWELNNGASMEDIAPGMGELFDACKTHFPDGIPENWTQQEADVVAHTQIVHRQPSTVRSAADVKKTAEFGRKATPTEAEARNAAMLRLMVEHRGISIGNLTAKLNDISSSGKAWPKVSEAHVERMFSIFERWMNNDPEKDDVPLQVYRAVLANPDMSKEEVVSSLSKSKIHSDSKNKSLAKFFNFARLFIEMGAHSGGVAPALNEGKVTVAMRNVMIMRMFASDQNLQASDIKKAIDDNSSENSMAPTIEAIDMIISYAKQVCRDLERLSKNESAEASSAAGTMYFLLLARPELRSDDIDVKRTLKESWCAKYNNASENQFANYRRYSILAIENDVFGGFVAT
ncbi:MAG: hypothetical protein V4636_02720 [Pseudomonadota bacterium]